MGLESVYGVGSLKTGVCTTATRPAAPFTGQTIYDTTVATTLVWSGSAWIASGGKVLQVVSTTKTDIFTTTSTSYTDITGLSVSITPSNATNKVLVFAQLNGSDEFGTAPNFIQMVRGTTAIDVGDAAGSRRQASAQLAVSYGGNTITSNLLFLDSPATTSATTYKIQILTNSGTTYVNRSKTDTDNNNHARTASTITVMEISA